MNYILNTFSKLSLAMLVLLSMVFFVMPAQEEAQAQSGTPRGVSYICVNTAAPGQFQKADTVTNPSNPACPPAWTLYSGQTSERGFCAGSKPPIQIKSPKDPSVTLNDNGDKCLVSLPDGTTGQMNFITFTSVTQQYGSGTYVPPVNTNTNPGGTNTNPRGNNNTNTTPPSTGGCDSGFQKVGPLCVPVGISGNNNSILGEQTAGGLAARIIRILLYFAGIVAVIMAIIGGYQVMTAAGNEQQAVNGRKTLINAIIGLVIVILSYLIIQTVINFVTKT